MNHRFLVFVWLLLLVQTFPLNFQTKTLKDDWKMTVVSCPGSFQSLSGKDFDVTVPSTLHLNL